MAKINRFLQKIFAQNLEATPTQGLSQVGSKAEGAPNFTADPTDIQALDSRWKGGWRALFIPSSQQSPTYDDFNSIFNVITKQILYLGQTGISEYHAGETYWVNSFVNYNGAIYRSLADNNQGFPVSNTSKWTPLLPAITIQKQHTFADMISLGSVSGPADWTSLDIGGAIASAGLTGITPVAAIVRAMVRFGPTPLSHANFEATLQVRGNTSASMGSLVARAFGATDDSATAGEDNVIGPVPLLNGNIIQYKQSQVNWAANGELYLVGFIYDKTL